MRKRRKWLRWWMAPLLICITGFVLFRCVLRIGYVPKISMELTQSFLEEMFVEGICVRWERPNLRKVIEKDTNE